MKSNNDLSERYDSRAAHRQGSIQYEKHNKSIDRSSVHSGGASKPNSKKKFRDDFDLNDVQNSSYHLKSQPRMPTEHSDKSYSLIEEISNGSGFDRLPHHGMP